MHFTKAFTFTAIVLAGAAFAAPSPPKPAKPVTPIIVDSPTQTNNCSGGTVFCCNGGDGSTANVGTCQKQIGGTCSSTGTSTTTICCQANNSIQQCLKGFKIK